MLKHGWICPLAAVLISLAYMQNNIVSASGPADQSNSRILVEIFLSKEHRGDIDRIVQELGRYSVTKIRPQFFPLGNPPENIAIGKAVPVDVAQSAIRLAITYNRGVRFIIAEKRLAPYYLAIGTSMFDERLQIPISPEDLNKLADPGLDSSRFHALYRQLAGDPE